MTTQVTDLYDAYLEMLETELTGYRRLANAYEQVENSSLQLSKGFGLGFGSAVNTNQFVGCQISLDRDFFIVLVHQLPVRENDGEQRADIEKALLEDAFKLVRAVEADPTIGGNGISTQFVADSGIEFLPGVKAKYFLVELQFRTTYFENINA